MKLYNLKLVHGVNVALEPALPEPLLGLPFTSSAKKLSPKFWFVQEQKSYLMSSWKRSIVFLVALQLRKCCAVLKHGQLILYRE